MQKLTRILRRPELSSGSSQRFALIALPGCAAVLLAGLTWTNALAQGLPGAKALKSGKGFSVSEYYKPQETQMKSMLEGARFQLLPGGQIQLTEGKRQTFRETGELDTVMEAPICIYDQAAGLLSSTNTVQMRAADGRFAIFGTGFVWRQTNSTLNISSAVHTQVRGNLVVPSAASNPQPPTGDAQSATEIFSERLDYATPTGLAIYRDAVRVLATNLTLLSDLLTVKLPRDQQPLEDIVAENNVQLEYLLREDADATRLQATAQRAVYAVQSGRITLTGAPAWRAGLREGRGDQLLLDRSNQVFQSVGQAWLKLQGQSLPTPGAMPSRAPAAAGRTNGRQSLEISSDRYEIRTNLAVFHDGVKVIDLQDNRPHGSLVCRELTATFAGTNQLQQLVAEGEVVIEQPEGRFTGDRAVYTAATGLLELTGHPTWQAGLRSGRGDRVTIRYLRQEMDVSGHAYLRLPTDELGQAAGAGMTTASTAPKSKNATGSRTNEFAEVFSDAYTLSILAQTGDFRGGVYATHPQLNYACEHLTVHFPQGDNAVRGMEASQAVSFDLVDEKQQKVHGIGDQASYSYSVLGKVTNDVLRLTGNPAVLMMLTKTNNLEITNGTLRNNLIILDRAKNKLMAPGGAWSLRGVAPSVDTNLYRLPDRRKSK